MVRFIESHLQDIMGSSSKLELSADTSSLASGSRQRETSPLREAPLSFGMTTTGRIPVIRQYVIWNCKESVHDIDIESLKERIKIVRRTLSLRDFRYRTCSERKKIERLIRRYMYREWGYSICFQCARSIAYSPRWVHSLLAATRATV